ncbi:HAD family hydrolase [Pseudorhodoferax sp.]|uniref:HAD family hydrolase n=1 Tax=Pseudorhodoferax sp. TaxID=1993553 RepID=UPI002DD63AEE|nr:HAD family hydrolase [Pseudorhodoferax sp.]
MDALLLDLDGTLLDDRTAVRTALNAFLSANRCELDGPQALVRWRKLADMHWRRFERGETSFEDQRRFRVREFLGIAMSDSEADAAFDSYRTAYENAWMLFPECVRFLERTAHLPKVVVTNGDKAQQLLKVSRCGLANHLTAVVTPMDCGAWKPDHRIFLAAVERLGLPVARCMMIGDDMERDIRPARELGLLTYHVDRNDPAASLLHAIKEI